MLNFRENANAFKDFIATHQQRVYNVVLTMVQQVHDAEEITQDVFVDVYRNPEVFRGDANITTWLYRIAMNKCIDHLRKKTRNRKWVLSTFIGSGNSDAGNDAPDFVHPGILSENKEKAAILFKAIRQLPAQQHTAWVLSEIENLSYKEISEVMKTSVPAVESLLVRARKNLRNILSNIYDNQ